MSMSPQTAVEERIRKQLCFALRDQHPNIRFLALEGLAFLPPDPADQAAVALLNDPDRFVKWRAIQLCGERPLPAAAKDLGKLIHNPEMTTRMYAAASLAAIGDPVWVPDLLELMRSDGSPRVRQGIVKAADRFSPAIPWDILSAGILDADIGVRQETAAALGRLAPDPNACQLLINLLEREGNSHVFATAILALGRFRSQPLLPYFQHSLLHQESRVRANAIEALGFYPFSLIETIIDPSRRDPSNRVKANVLSIFLSYGFDDRVQADLYAMLSSTNRWEQASAAWLAGTYAIAVLGDALLDLLTSEESIVAERAAWALGRIRPATAFSRLVMAFPRAGSWAQPHFIKAMGVLAGPKDHRSLLALTEQEANAALKSMFIELLADHGVTEARDTVASLCLDPDHRTRGAAYFYLAKVDGLKAADLLLKGLADPNLRVRARCGELMLRLGDFRALRTLSALLNDSDKQQRVQAGYTLKEVTLLVRKPRGESS
jgi:HEAT repeat protein